jgi:hypothetical protein
MFNIGGGMVVDFWSNGVLTPNSNADYGVAVATSALALDYVAGGVSASVVPESSTWATILAGFAFLGLAGVRRTRRASRALP